MREVVWVDINSKEYAIEEIDDRYLLNILKFISRGGGYTWFMSDEIITKLYQEADRRKLKHSLKLKDLIIAYHTKCAFESLYDCEDFN